MTTTSQTPTAVGLPDSKPSGLSRLIRFLGRLILAFLKLLPAFIIIIALLASAWLGYRELRRSFGVVNNRIDWYDEQMSTLSSENTILSAELASQKTHQSELAAYTKQVDDRILAVIDDLAGNNES